MAVEQVVVYPDRTELVYTIRDIPQTVLFDPMTDDVSLSCGGPESYANLKLPDGTILYAENYLLDGKAYILGSPAAWKFAIHLYNASIPEDISELIFVLNCVELIRLDRGFQNWEIPFRIVPAG